jgi:membrane associated rhomboid family serine protease
MKAPLPPSPKPCRCIKYLFILLFLTVHLCFDASPGYTLHSPLWTHFTYMFQHASITHLIINSLSFLTIFHLMSSHIRPPLLSVVAILCAFAATFVHIRLTLFGHPLTLTTAFDLPTVGASAMIYALSGMYLYQLFTLRCPFRIFRPLTIAITISLTFSFFTPGSNFALHLSALLAGTTARLILRVIGSVRSTPLG